MSIHYPILFPLSVPISCGNQQLKASSIGQQFHSPEWPRNYPKGLECVWRIEAPSGQLISLSIDEFNTEAETDFLTIYDGPSPSEPILAKFSGQMVVYFKEILIYYHNPSKFICKIIFLEGTSTHNFNTISSPHLLL